MSLSVCVSTLSPLLRCRRCKGCIKEMKMLLNKRAQEDMKRTREQIIHSVIVPGWLENNCCNADLHNELKLTIRTFQPQLISPDPEYITQANKEVLISQSSHVCEWVSDVGGEGFCRLWHQWFNLAPLCCGGGHSSGCIVCMCVCVLYFESDRCVCALW